METLNDRMFKIIDENKDLSDSKLAKHIECSKSTVSRWRKEGLTPHSKYTSGIAEFLGVSERYLLVGGDKEKTDKLSKKEKIDIAKEVSSLLNGLASDNALMFDGEEIDDTTRTLLEKSLQGTLETARIIAKEKFTPKKYKK